MLLLSILQWSNATIYLQCVPLQFPCHALTALFLRRDPFGPVEIGRKVYRRGNCRFPLSLQAAFRLLPLATAAFSFSRPHLESPVYTKSFELSTLACLTLPDVAAEVSCQFSLDH